MGDLARTRSSLHALLDTMIRAFAFTIAAALLFTACGSDDEATPTQTIEVTTSTQAPEGSSDFESALLTPADAGEGFVAESTGQDSDEPIGCAALDSISDKLNGAEAKGEVLLSNPTTGDLINQSIARSDSAEDDFSAFNTAIADCASFTVQLQGQSVTFTAVPIEVTTVGDESKAGRFTTSLLGVPVNVDYVIFRDGDALSALLSTSYDNAAPTRIQELATKAAGKLNS